MANDRAPGTCGTCGRPLRDMDAGGDRCNNCWEVERRIAEYLRGGERARAVVLQALVASPSDEMLQARNLWERLVTLWEIDLGDDYDGRKLIDAIGALVDEWQGFADKTDAPT